MASAAQTVKRDNASGARREVVRWDLLNKAMDASIHTITGTSGQLQTRPPCLSLSPTHSMLAFNHSTIPSRSLL
jgi:hypothetical protein